MRAVVPANRARVRTGLQSVAASFAIGAFAIAIASDAFSQRSIRDDDTVPLRGSVPRFARPDLDTGATNPDLEFERMVLVLDVRANASGELAELLKQQQDPTSSLYHRWLTPTEFGRRFGITDVDLLTVKAWITRNGFRIDEVAKGRGWINFSGTVRDVERVFKTPIRDYWVGDRLLRANAKDPEIPRALARVIAGIASLNNEFSKPLHKAEKPVPQPQYAIGSTHYLAPSDFAIIYNLTPLYSSGFDGSRQVIAVAGRTDIKLTDVATFRNTFGLAANNPVIIHNGPTPGILDSGEEGEGDLDVEWAGAIAPNATIDFVVSANTATTGGELLSSQYIINNDLAPVMTLSFLLCEQAMSPSFLTLYNNMWAQAAAQGITVFVASGDAGAAGCDNPNDVAVGTMPAVSGFCSTPNNVCVGGTQFMDSASPSTYWSSGGAALGYILEAAWNASGSVSGGSGLWSGGGGPSTIYSKPSWQSAAGVPNDGMRDTPDISLSAATHDGYLVYREGQLLSFGGTSAASPSMAGIMSLVVQKTGARQGNANPLLYRLAAAQFNGGASVFHDITSGNNSVPGVTGYTSHTAYDLVTGIGSVNASALANAWSNATAADFYVAAPPTIVTALPGGSATLAVTTTAYAGFNASISLSSSNVPAGIAVSFNPTSVQAPGNGTSTITVAIGGNINAGTNTFTLTASGGGKSHSVPITVSVTTNQGPQELVIDGGFEAAASTGNIAPGWTVLPTSGHTLIIQAGSFPHNGTNYAYLGSSNNSLDIIKQTITLPSNATAISCTFWVNIVTQEIIGAGAYDALYIDLYNTNGAWLHSIAAFSNESATSSNNANGTYFKVGPVDLTSYKGSTLQLVFEADTDFSLPTTFRVDDVSVAAIINCSYGISPQSASIAGTGGTGTISVTATNSCAWTAVSNSSFITITQGTSGSGNGSVSYSVAPNTSGQRSGTVTVAGSTFTINQSAGSVAAPFGLVAAAISTSQVNITWTANGASTYQLFRKVNAGLFSLIGTTTSSNYNDSGLTAATAYLYQVRGVDTSGNVSPPSNSDLATTIFFTDDPLVAGSTFVKAIHLVELRTAINAVQVLAGQPATLFTDSTLTTAVGVKAIHVAELRSALDAARSALGISALTYTDPTIVPGVTLIKTVHLAELRMGVE